MGVPQRGTDGGLHATLTYVLARVEQDGMIYVDTRGQDYYDAPLGRRYISERVVHWESYDIPAWPGIFCAQKLETVKEKWNGDNQIILGLDRDGAVDRLWVGKAQHAFILQRLDRWKMCYGNWPIRSLG